MRVPAALPDDLLLVVRRQDGAITSAQAAAAGLTARQLRTLTANGWRRPTRGVLIEPRPADPFRASVRAALLACPDAVVCEVTAARLRELWGLPKWTVTELPHVILPVGRTYGERAGVRVHSGLRPGEAQVVKGFPTTTLARTITDLVPVLATDRLVCLLDSALRRGWLPDPALPRGRKKLRAALELCDARSESAFETLVRVLLTRADVAPEALQYELFDASGRVYARLDMAWPSRKLALEADGREVHDLPDALYHDRVRANDLELAGWTILRFTWFDLMRRPEWVVNQVQRALNRKTVVKRAG